MNFKNEVYYFRIKGAIKMNKKRADYISWDEYFMSIAKLSSKRSKDPSTQVGACIVSNDNRILSIGYNLSLIHI